MEADPAAFEAFVNAAPENFEKWLTSGSEEK